MAHYNANPFAGDEDNPFAGDEDNPFAGDEDNPFANPGSVPPAGSRLSPLAPERVKYDCGATVDIPLDNAKDTRKKEKELQAKEAQLNRREEELKKREEAAAKAGIVIETKNWPPFLPIIHLDIANEIQVHLQKIQYICCIYNFVGFGSMPALELYSSDCSLDQERRSTLKYLKWI